jgi:hypothetical protein
MVITIDPMTVNTSRMHRMLNRCFWWPVPLCFSPPLPPPLLAPLHSDFGVVGCDSLTVDRVVAYDAVVVGLDAVAAVVIPVSISLFVPIASASCLFSISSAEKLI